MLPLTRQLQATLPYFAVGANSTISGLFNFKEAIKAYCELENNLHGDLQRARLAQKSLAHFNSKFARGCCSISLIAHDYSRLLTLYCFDVGNLTWNIKRELNNVFDAWFDGKHSVGPTRAPIYE